MNHTIATIGYEGSALRPLIATLQKAGVDTVVDIRDRPLSRRAGFSKNTLAAALNENGIGYVHLKGLGNPKENRTGHGSFAAGFARHMQTEDAQSDLQKAATLAQTKNICLLCYEAKHEECHRQIVADHMRQLTGFNIVPLTAPKAAAARTDARQGQLI